MNLSAVLLVVISGVIHATWNYLAKSSKDKLSFLWAVKVISIVLLTPIFAYRIIGSSIIPQAGTPVFRLLLLGFASGFVHFLYSYFLSQAYEYGDISFSYPIARGSAPFIVVFFSYLFLAETPSISGLVGMVLVASGVVFLVKSRRQDIENGDEKSTFSLSLQNPFLFASLTALMIAIFVLLDGIGARDYTPLIFMYFYSLVSTVLLTFLVFRNPGKIYREFSQNFMSILGAGIMMPLSYLLALHAMRLTQLGYVASLRNISVVFATFLGIRQLDESSTLARVFGSFVVFAGALALGLS